ncbi:MAG: hypothetical protein V8R14_00555 [Clostridia bacterium]
MGHNRLANQSRLALAGEIWFAITHQWKQPLNNINIVMGNLKDDIMSGELDEQTHSCCLQGRSYHRMSFGTLSDFTEYQPDTKLVAFSVSDVINAASDSLPTDSARIGITLISMVTALVYLTATGILSCDTQCARQCDRCYFRKRCRQRPDQRLICTAPRQSPLAGS